MEFARPDAMLTDRFANFARRAVTELSAAAVPLGPVDETRDVLVVVDMIADFAEEGGALYSPRIKGIRGPVEDTAYAFAAATRIFVCEAHSEDAPEYARYGPHGGLGTEGAKLLPELADRLGPGDLVVGKNSTNAMESDGFRQAVAELVRGGVRRFAFVGDCTDICVMQSSMTFRAWLDERDIGDVEVGVLLPAVETFDLAATNHDGDIMNIAALHIMAANGIVLYSGLG